MAAPPKAVAGPYKSSLNWKTIKTAHFSIHYYDGEEASAEKLATISEEVYGVLAKKFNEKPWGRTEVVVTDADDLANGFTTILPYNYIQIRLAPPFPDSSLADYDSWLRELFTHEYTHVMHLGDAGYPAKVLKYVLGKIVAPNALTPGWVIEGLATYFETAETNRGGRGRSSFTEMLLRTDILQKHFLHLDQMAGTQYDWPGWLAQYLYGVGFWEYLSDTYGEKTLTRFSREYGSSFWFFALNHQAKRIYKDKNGKGESFYTLWDNWKADLEKRYGVIQKEVEKTGLREGSSFLAPQVGETFSLPTFSPDGKQLAYLAGSVNHPLQLRLRDLETGKDRILLVRKNVQQIGFSPDGKKLIISYVWIYKHYDHYSDLYEIELATGKITRLTEGKRARDADYSPDGKKLVAVLQETSRSQLAVYDLESKEWKTISAPEGSYDYPRWLPDGRSVVVTAHENGKRNIYIVDIATGKQRAITNDTAVNDHPVPDVHGQAIYFTSDKSGITNIYRYDLKSGKILLVTNVMTGAFEPNVAPNGEVAFRYYEGKGFELRKLEAPRSAPVSVAFIQRPYADRRHDAFDSTAVESERASGITRATRVDGESTETPEKFSGKRQEESLPPGETLPTAAPSAPEKYSPFAKLFVPRYILPTLSILDNAIYVAAMVGNNDPLERHEWFGDINYRTDNNFVGFDLGYIYNRFLIPMAIGYEDYSVNYGNVFGFGTNYYEHRRRAYTGITLPLTNNLFTFQYFFENRQQQSGVPPGTTVATEGDYAGLFMQYAFKDSKGTAAGISPEQGQKLTLNLEMTDHALGASSDLEQEVVWGDARTYLKMPWAQHQVLAMRAEAGGTFGDQLVQGNFGLGGSVGDSLFIATSSRVFSLRGLPLVSFSRDFAWVTSAEYRFPLFRLQRGIGTLPIALNSAHFAVFADLGDAFNRGTPGLSPMLGVGGELRGDFVVGYHVPVMGRLGYGIVVTNRARLNGLVDTLSSADAQHGVIVLEVGTSF
jgi:hypothetical protein